MRLPRTTTAVLLLLLWRPVTAHHRWSFTKATFIPPAHPPAAHAVTDTHTGTIAVASSTHIARRTTTTTTTTALGMAKKKAAPAAKKMMQVKLLQHVAGTGQAGDIVQVSPAFYNNQLRPKHLAQIISDEQVALDQAAAAAAWEATQATALRLRARLEAAPLVLKRKADGHNLFGGVGVKVIVDELKVAHPEQAEFLSGKSVKVTALLDGNGKKMRGDIKQTGSFAAIVALTKEISAKVAIEVQADE